MTLDGVRAEMASLGAVLQETGEDQRARTFRLEATGAPPTVHVRLVVQDLVFRDTVREVDARDCTEATRSLALLVATALDEAPPEAVPAPKDLDDRWAWPEPQRDAVRSPEEERDRGRAGIALTGIGAIGLTGGSTGAHLVATKAVGVTRLGLGAAFTQEDWSQSAHSTFESAQGTAARLGAHLGWGAPWTNHVVGFALEVGAVRPDLRGDRFDGPRHWRNVGAYGSAHFVIQIPIRVEAVRPYVALGYTGRTAAPAFQYSGEVGFAWRAW